MGKALEYSKLWKSEYSQISYVQVETYVKNAWIQYIVQILYSI